MKNKKLVIVGCTFQKQGAEGLEVNPNQLNRSVLNAGSTMLVQSFFSGIIDLERRTGNLMPGIVFNESKLSKISLRTIPSGNYNSLVILLLEFSESAKHELAPSHALYGQASNHTLPDRQEWVGELDFLEQKGFIKAITIVVEESFFDSETIENIYKSFDIKKLEIPN